MKKDTNTEKDTTNMLKMSSSAEKDDIDKTNPRLWMQDIQEDISSHKRVWYNCNQENQGASLSRSVLVDVNKIPNAFKGESTVRVETKNCIQKLPILNTEKEEEYKCWVFFQ